MYPLSISLGRAASRVFSTKLASVKTTIKDQHWFNVSRQLDIFPRPITRSMWHLCSSWNNSNTSIARVKTSGSWSTACSCGCGMKGVHTKGDKELLEFLKEEIAAEKSAAKPVPKTLNEFEVTYDQADITLKRTFQGENIVVSVNVNHSVDAENIPEEEHQADKDEMKSKPTFDVDIEKGSKIMTFTCSFAQEVHNAGDAPTDVFNIDEVAVYEGEYKDETYAVSGDILDGYLYDLLMNMLEERGISNDFAGSLSNLATAYEQSLYVKLLENLGSFVKS